MAITETTPVEPLIPHDFDEEEHIFTNAVTKERILSVTQVLDSVDIVDYSGAPQAAMTRKSHLGKLAHRATEYIDSPNSELDWDTIDKRIKPYVVGWEEFCLDWDFEPRLTEYRGCVKLAQGAVGFIIDRVGLMDDRQYGRTTAIIEIKCTCKEEQSWPIQLAGYESCLLQLGLRPEGAPVFTRAAVQLLPEPVNGKFYKYFPYQDRMDRRVWEMALALTTWKLLHGYKLK